jgi:hypothetical protein
MEAAVVRERLAEAAKSVPDLRAFAYLPEAIDPPTFVAGEVTIDYDQVEEGGWDQLEVICHLYTSTSLDRAGQKLLDGYLARTGSRSIKTALQADPTLGGICTTLRLTQATGYGKYEIAGATYYGSRLVVHVWGS